MAQIFYHDKISASPGAIYFYHDKITGASAGAVYFYHNKYPPVEGITELVDIANDIRTAYNLIQDDVVNDFRMSGAELIDIFNDFRMNYNLQHKDISNDFRLVEEIMSNVNNKFNTVKLEAEDTENKFNSCIEATADANMLASWVKEITENVDNDIRTKKIEINDIANDFRMLSPWQIPIAGELGLQSLGKEEVRVYINDVEQTDANIDSITITQNLNTSAIASFELGRAYDDSKPNQKSVVKIKYKDYLIYQGYIVEITPTNNPESMKIECRDEYWELNKTKKYFFVGHEPKDTTDYYYNTAKQALQSLGFNFNIGDFIPQTIDCFGQGVSEIISNLVENSGNFAWFIAPNGTKKLWQAGKGAIVNLQEQVIGINMSLYQVVKHDIKENIANIVNKLRVQMGNKTIRKSTSRSLAGEGQWGTGEKEEHVYHSYYSNYLEPAWDSSLEVLMKDSSDGYGWDRQDPNKDYGDVFRKFRLPGLNSDRASWSDILPPVVAIRSGRYFFDETYNYTKEGFTIDYEGVVTHRNIFGRLSYYIAPVITFSEPQVLYDLNQYNEVTNIRAKTVRLYLAQEKKVTYNPDSPEDEEPATPDPDTQPEGTPLSFYTDKMGDYPETILGTLNLSNLSIQEGSQVYMYAGYASGVTEEQEAIPSWNDTEFARDYADWQLSKTCDIKTEGTINLTIDAMCFYNIDLSKRIKIAGVVDPINITSISYNFRDFTATLTLESGRYYKRSVSIPSHGE